MISTVIHYIILTLLERSIKVYYIDTDKIPGFFRSLKITSSSHSVKILFLSFTFENIGVIMITNLISR